MTPLHLRRHLRAVVTMIAGAAPDDAAKARAVYRTAYDCGDDEPIAELMRQVLDEVTYQKRARDATDRALTDAAEESYKLRTELADVDDALYAALDIRPDSPQAATMYAPGGVRRLAAERDEAVALISTLRAEHAAAREDEASAAETLARVMGELADVKRDRDRIYAKQQEDVRILVLLWEWTHDAGNQYVPTGGDADTFGDGVRRAQERVQNILATRRPVADDPPPKRKRTKEERAERERAHLRNVWQGRYGDYVRQALAGGPLTSREVATRIHGPDTPAELMSAYMRDVTDLARAGYLTVAKGPGGVRVYGLKEGE